MPTPPGRRALRRPHLWLITVVAILGAATVPFHFAAAGANGKEGNHATQNPQSCSCTGTGLTARAGTLSRSD
jgi:hypothetical protein